MEESREKMVVRYGTICFIFKNFGLRKSVYDVFSNCPRTHEELILLMETLIQQIWRTRKIQSRRVSQTSSTTHSNEINTSTTGQMDLARYDE
jgi:hypothetical protein